MSKTLKLVFLFCIVLLAGSLMLMACVSESATTEITTVVTTTKAPHIHEYGNWNVIKKPSYTEEGLQAKYCSCGANETASIAKKTPQKITLTPENFWTYFYGTFEHIYVEYSNGKVLNYVTINVTSVIAQATLGNLENVSVTFALYPRGGRWDVTNFDEGDRALNLVIPSNTGAVTGHKEMGFATTQPLFSDDVREPDKIDVVITSVTGTITIYP